MLRILICPDGDQLTCSILRIADALGKDPGNFQWWESIWIPTIGAAASVAVLIFSVWTTNRSRKEVKASEQARKDDESNRQNNERRQRFTGRIADILDLLPDVVDSHRTQQTSRQGVGTTGAVSVSPLIIGISAAMLEGDKDERRMLQYFRQLVLHSETVGGPLQSKILALGSDLLVDWVVEKPSMRVRVTDAMQRVSEAKTLEEISEIRATSRIDLESSADETE